LQFTLITANPQQATLNDIDIFRWQVECHGFIFYEMPQTISGSAAWLAPSGLPLAAFVAVLWAAIFIDVRHRSRIFHES
jgi:hypothetical protein